MGYPQAMWLMVVRFWVLCGASIKRRDGAGDRSRTYDLRITNALLYQLSYTGNGMHSSAVVP